MSFGVILSNWYKKHTSDQFVKKANKEGQRSRAAYKLIEIQEKRNLVKKGDCVLDLGSAPGAWSEALVKMVGVGGKVVACDLLLMEPIQHVSFVQGNFLDEATQQAIQGYQLSYDVIVSDMAPDLTGQYITDQANMLELIEQAFVFCSGHLKPGGKLLVKCFSGALQNEINTLFKNNFSKIKVIKPDASRSASKEIYLIGEGFRV